jgi:hypothetical protein
MQVALAVDWPFGCCERLSNLLELRELGNVGRDYLPSPWGWRIRWLIGRTVVIHFVYAEEEFRDRK